MKGKEICNILREIRKRIAEENGIPYQPMECNHVEDCLGTCPYCEQEADYLLEELEKKESQGDVVRTIDKKNLMQTIDRAYVAGQQIKEGERLPLENERRKRLDDQTLGYVGVVRDDEWRQKWEEARKQKEKNLEEMKKRRENGLFRKLMRKLFNRKSDDGDH